MIDPIGIPKHSMNIPAQPTEYCLEIYESSFVNTPVQTINSKTPFLAISIGDYVDPAIWREQLADDAGRNWFRVRDLVHRVHRLKSHNTHQIGILIEAADNPMHWPEHPNQ